MNKKFLRRVLIAIVLAVGLVAIAVGAYAAPGFIETTVIAPSTNRASASVPSASSNGAIKLATPAPPDALVPKTNAPSVKTNSVEPHYPTNADPRFNTNGFYRGVGTNRVPSN